MAGKYISIYESVRKDIVGGFFKSGEKIPSKRTLAEEYGVSVITVEHAYELLLEEGYIESRERSGYYVIYSERDGFLGERAAVGKAGSPAANQHLPGPADALSASIYAKTTRKVLSLYEEEVLMKSPAFGTDKLRIALSGYLRRSRHIDVSPNRIIIGAGAEYLYGLVVKCLGRELIYGIEYPGYHRIEEVYLGEGARVEHLPLIKDGIESASLWSSTAEVLHVTPYRSFPSGVTATPGKKMEYLCWSQTRNGYLIEDDFESEFTPLRKAEDTIFSMDSGGRTLYVNTFTRTISPGVRLAYMLLPEALTELFEEKVGFYSCPVPVLEQYVVAQLIENGDFERHINRVRRQNRLKNE